MRYIDRAPVVGGNPNSLSAIQSFVIEQAIEGAFSNPYEAIKNSIEALTGTEADIQDEDSETIMISRSAVLEVLAKLDALAQRSGLDAYYTAASLLFFSMAVLNLS